MNLEPYEGEGQWVAVRAGEVVAAGAPEEVLRDEVLAEVYGDEHVRARRPFGRTFVWSEL